jgi:hypothetical protein
MTQNASQMGQSSSSALIPLTAASAVGLDCEECACLENQIRKNCLFVLSVQEVMIVAEFEAATASS